MSEPSPTSPSPTGAGPPTGSVRVPRVFISYAHDSDAHREQVRDLWIFLRANGIDARIDRVAAEQRQDWTLWMERHVAEADHILVVGSPAYKKRASHEADPGEGRGVQYEARLIRNLFYDDQSAPQRFLPVVLPGGGRENLPTFLTPAIATVYEVSAFAVEGAEPLLRVLLGRPAEVEPALGAAPDLPPRRPPHHLYRRSDGWARGRPSHCGGRTGAAPSGRRRDRGGRVRRDRDGVFEWYPAR